MIRDRHIYRLPEGEWMESKEDDVDFYYSASLGPMPYWSFKYQGRKFSLDDLKNIVKVPLSRVGMLKVLREYGGWRLCNPPVMGGVSSIKDATGVHFVSWYFDALKIMRAYSLLGSLRRGEAPEWELVKHGTLPSLRIISWPERLRTSFEGEPLEFCLSFAGPITSAEADHEDLDTARKLAKRLLSELINEELRAVTYSFAYDFEEDNFRTDVAENEVLDLKVACWLIVRDLTAGLSGLRFCQAPGCKNPIDPGRRADMKHCGSSACKKRLQRHNKNARKRRKRQENEFNELLGSVIVNASPTKVVSDRKRNFVRAVNTQTLRRAKLKGLEEDYGTKE